MIPEHDLGGARPQLTLEFAFVLALLAPMMHVLCTIVLSLIGFRGHVAVVGMGAVLTYAGIFALCAARFRRPPMQQLALLRAPGYAWLAVACLLASVVLTSEVDNLVKAVLPPPPEFAQPGAELPPYFGETMAVVMVGVLPLAYELFFRGVLQPLAVARIGVVAGILLSAGLSGLASGLIFGFPWALVPAFLNALVFSVLRQSSGSLFPPLALHALVGLAVVGAQFEVFGLAGFDDASAPHTPLAWLAGSAVLTGAGFALCRAAARARKAAA